MARFDFCGATYQSQSPNVDAERAINLFPEVPESPGAKSRMALYGTPGQKLFAALGATDVLGIFACRPNGSSGDRLFAVVQSGANQALYEVFSDGTNVNRGALIAPTNFPVTMQHNGIQLAICTGGQVWIFTFATNVLALAASAPTNVAMIEYCDGFFIALIANSNKFQISALLDGTNWPGLSVAQVSEFPDNVISMIVNQRGLWFAGTKAIVPYYNAGAIAVPFLPVSGVFIEGGSGAPFGRSKLDNSVMWWDADERGNAIARRANGYIPQRISNHAVEFIVGSYPTIADAISYAYSEFGHTFWVTYFPSGTSTDGVVGAGATWVYDVATSLWHERAFWNQTKGHFEAHHSQNHAFAFGKHLVGDWSTGNIYQLSALLYDDAGNPKRWVRRAPHVTNEAERVFIHKIQLDMETGLPSNLTGTSSDIESFNVVDANGQIWQITIDDLGTPRTSPIASGVISAPLINDSVTPNQTWTIGVDITGHIGVVAQTSWSMRASMFLPMSSTGGKQTGFYISSGVWATLNPISPVRGVKVQFRYSKDHAHTFSNYEDLDAGQTGEYTKRVIRRRLGQARSFTPEFSGSDPVPVRLVDCYIDGSSRGDEFKPTQRLVKTLAKAG